LEKEHNLIGDIISDAGSSNCTLETQHGGIKRVLVQLQQAFGDLLDAKGPIPKPCIGPHGIEGLKHQQNRVFLVGLRIWEKACAPLGDQQEKRRALSFSPGSSALGLALALVVPHEHDKRKTNWTGHSTACHYRNNQLAQCVPEFAQCWIKVSVLK
jgi:hypothetical protein